MWKVQCLLSVLKQSYICYHVICMIVPLIIILLDVTVRNAHLKCENIQKQFSER